MNDLKQINYQAIKKTVFDLYQKSTQKDNLPLGRPTP